jgi:hypothetical protein
MTAAWQGPLPRPVEVLPAEVPLSQLLARSPLWDVSPDTPLAVPFALEATTMSPLPINLSDGPYFLITGPPSSGKTTLIQTWLLSLAECFPPERVKFYLMGLGDQRLMPFRALPHTTAYVEDAEQLTRVLDELSTTLEERRQALAQARRDSGGVLDEQSFMARHPALVVATDDFDQFRVHTPESDQDRLAELMGRGRNLGLYVFAVSPTRGLASSYATLVAALKESQTGFLVGSADSDHLSIFDIYSFRMPMSGWGKSLPPGRGFFLRRGQARPLQVASCHAGEPGLVEWIRQIAGKRTSDQQADQPKGPGTVE